MQKMGINLQIFTSKYHRLCTTNYFILIKDTAVNVVSVPKHTMKLYRSEEAKINAFLTSAPHEGKQHMTKKPNVSLSSLTSLRKSTELILTIFTTIFF
jgi:ureidoglycolate hydrolase